MSFIAAALALAFPALVIVGAVRDTVSYTIPNWVSLALVGLFPLAALAVQLPAPTLGLHLLVGVAALVTGMVMFALRWVGGGDAKLFAAAALWLGWHDPLSFIGVTGVAGGALTLLLLSLRSMYLRPYALGGPGWLVRLAEPGAAVPYGVAIAAGALAAFPATPFAAALDTLR